VQRVAYSRAGVWFFSRTLHHIDMPLLRLSGNRFCVATVLAGIPVISLTTTGAKSGQARTLPVLAIEDGDRYVVIASSWGRTRHPGWYYNLRANPTATVETKQRRGAYSAREVEGEEREMFWRRAVEIYPGFEVYKRTAGRRHIGMFALEPEQ
jgi:deazaflavin-dependent oxidoreductase (nitroreductase family)